MRNFFSSLTARTPRCARRSTSSGRRNTVALAVLLGALAALSALSACGGGADDAAPSSSLRANQALPEKQSENSVQAASRRVRSGDVKGVTALVMSRDQASMGVANADGRVMLLNTSGQEIKRLQGTGSSITAGLVFSANDRYLVAVSRDSSATAWNVQTGERRFSLSGHEHGLRTVSASADGSLIATGGEETRVMLWDGSTGRLKQILRGPTDFVNSVSVSADARYVASGDATATVHVWSVASGKILHTLRGHQGEVNAVTFSANSRWLASADQTGKVLLWDVASGRSQSALLGQQAAVRSLAFDADSNLLASGAADGKVVVWDVATHLELPSVQGWRVALSGGSTTVPQSTAAVSAVNTLVFTASTAMQLMVGNDDSHVHSLSVQSASRR
jgi:WD40 repeat protein